MLVDNQNLEPGNLDRHRLGANNSFLPKATSLADEIKRVMPGLNVRPTTDDVREVNLEGFDLLIDATLQMRIAQFSRDQGVQHAVCGDLARPRGRSICVLPPKRPGCF
jgi:molybdopterin/thiamine biosynthesis adenylyltransferase